MTKAEKAGLEAYPENISYSSVYDTMKDYNAEKRRLFIEGYEQGCKDTIDHPTGGELLHVLNKGCNQGYKDAVEKAYRWLLEQMFELNEGGEIYVADGDASSIKEFMDNFKKAMENNNDEGRKSI